MKTSYHKSRSSHTGEEGTTAVTSKCYNTQTGWAPAIANGSMVDSECLMSINKGTTTLQNEPGISTRPGREQAKVNTLVRMREESPSVIVSGPRKIQDSDRNERNKSTLEPMRKQIMPRLKTSEFNNRKGGVKKVTTRSQHSPRLFESSINERFAKPNNKAYYDE